MTDVRFYHLTRKTMEQALPELLEKTHARGLRSVVMAGSAERVEALASHLWTYKPNFFLPHGTARDGHAEQQPIWITELDENPNGATVLFLVDGAATERTDRFDILCEIFDGHDEAAVRAARAKWKTHQGAGHAISYWRQTEKGWTKEA